MTRSSSAEPGGAADQLHSGRRTLAVLEAIAARPHGATPKEIGKTLGLHLSTCYRLLNTLLAAGYVVRSPDGLFHLGRRLAYLNHRYAASIRPRPEVLAFLHALQLATGETSMLFRLEGDDVITSATVGGSRAGAYPVGYVGQAGPAHAVAAGRVLLAWLPAAQQEAFFERCESAPGLPGFLPANAADLREELEKIRNLGYALDRGDRNPDVCCLAAPIRDYAGASSAVAVIAPCRRLLRDEAQTRPILIEVSRAIGGVIAAMPAPQDDVDASDLAPEAVTQAAIEAAMATLSDAMSRVT